MLQYLLWTEIVLKIGSGVLLGLFPATTSKLFGLPASGDTFWQRLLAGLLIGLGLATVLQGSTVLQGAFTPGRGLGLAGSMAVNLSAAAMIAAHLSIGRHAIKRRGTLLLWGVVIVLTGLSLAELAFV
jgi:hypothetical protein